jgi:hypothetical protein
MAAKKTSNHHLHAGDGLREVLKPELHADFSL